jgi:adenine-specific DNA-methyltransferase
MAGMDAGNEIWFGPDGKSTPSRKSFLSDVKAGVTPVTIWPHDEVGHTHEANNELKGLLGQGIFDNPKPTRLIRRMIELAAADKDSSSIVLDFFAGSGTTGHAVMAQNALDGGNRRFILIQLPEPLSPSKKEQAAAAELCDKLGKPRNIAELTKERLRRSGKELGKDSLLLAERGGFRSFKLDSSNIRAWNPDRTDFSTSLLDSQEHIEANRSDADIVYELLLKLGLDMCVPMESRVIAGKTVGAIGSGVLLICLAERIDSQDIEELSSGIVSWHRELAPTGDTTVVFRDSAFSDDISKVNLTAILGQFGIANVRSL